MRWTKVALSLFIFTFLEIMVVLFVTDLPIINTIWTESGGTITQGQFMTFAFGILWIITVVVHLFAVMKG